jgi:hypothetical protein
VQRMLRDMHQHPHSEYHELSDDESPELLLSDDEPTLNEIEIDLKTASPEEDGQEPGRRRSRCSASRSRFSANQAKR